MKKAVITTLFIIAMSLAHLYGQEVDYELTLDFSAEQTNLPYPNYAAAYLVNTADAPLVFSAGSWGWEGVAVLIGNEGEEIVNEVLSDVNDTTTLQPKERIKVYSVAFSSENRTKYLFSYLAGSVYIKGQKKSMKAYFKPGEVKK